MKTCSDSRTTRISNLTAEFCKLAIALNLLNSGLQRQGKWNYMIKTTNNKSIWYYIKSKWYCTVLIVYWEFAVWRMMHWKPSYNKHYHREIRNDINAHFWCCLINLQQMLLQLFSTQNYKVFPKTQKHGLTTNPRKQKILANDGFVLKALATHEATSLLTV